MKALMFFLVLFGLGACSHQASKVNCEEHLTAINPPTPVVKSATTPPTPAMTPKPDTP